MTTHKPESTATDNIYLHRELRLHMGDGGIISSRDANWHKVELRKVNMLELIIKGKTYRIRKSDLPSSFIEFVHFRSKGINFVIDANSKLSVPEEHNSWSIGWSDGTNEHIAEIDFATGNLNLNYVRPVTKSLPSHFHPQSQVWERGAR